MSDLKQQLIQARVIAIIRGNYVGVYRPLVDALLQGGVRALEITMSSEGVIEAVQMIAAEYGDQILVGAGTVTEVEQVAQIHEAGGRFIVSPDTFPDVIQAALTREMEPIPGALTPTEAMTAYRAGARLVKLFPATLGGVNYLKQLRAPLNMIDFVPTGGIDADNVADYFAAGAVAVGVGSALVKKDFDGSAQAVQGLITHTRRLMNAAAQFFQVETP